MPAITNEDHPFGSNGTISPETVPGIGRDNARFGILLFDLDSDGDRDLIFNARERLLWSANDGSDDFTNFNDPKWVWQTIHISGGNGEIAQSVVPFDADNDGDTDLVYGGEMGRIWWSENIGTPTAPAFNATGAPWQVGPGGTTIDPTWGVWNSMDLGDLDGDGDQDMVIADSTEVRVLENIGSDAAPEFVEVDYTQVTGEPPVARSYTNSSIRDTGSVNLFDVDGDGDLDMLLGTATHVDCFENVGPTVLAFPDFIPAGSSPADTAYNPWGSDPQPDRRYVIPIIDNFDDDPAFESFLSTAYSLFYFEGIGEVRTDLWDTSNVPRVVSPLPPSYQSDGNDDSDGDGMRDSTEILYGLDPLDLDDAESDLDGDGLSAVAELTIHQTNPTRSDTDGDGLLDGDEVADGLDPTDPVDLWSLGDANCDGSSTIVDALVIVQLGVQTRTASNCPLSDPTLEANAMAADFDGDGEVTIIDALLVAQCSVGSCPP